MFAVIFEVKPKKERWNDYLDFAKFLKPELERIEGFIDNERFSSMRTQGLKAAGGERKNPVQAVSRSPDNWGILSRI